MRRKRFGTCVRALGFALAAAAAACGDDATSTSGPSPVGGSGNSLEGRVAALSGSCPSLTFTVQRVTVRTTSATVFTPVRCTRISNGMQVEVEGAPQRDGTVLASEVEGYF